MNYFSMALNNIRKKSESYFSYFLSTTFAVSIFYIFCSIYYNPAFMKFHTGTMKIELIFKASAFVVLAFSGVFVYYANSLFIKSRKKEIAIYSLLGMKKKEIGNLLFLETLIVGIGSVITGIFFGCLFGRSFSMLLMKLMLGGAPGNELSFHLTWQPGVISFGVFLILFMLNAISSFRSIYRSSLMELLSAEKTGEVAPKFSWRSAVLSVLLIGMAYAVFLRFNGDEGALQLLKPSIAAAVLLIIGTWLLFQNAVIFLLSKCRGNDKIYLKTNNFVSISQLIYRIKANANLFSVIALLSAFTITMMSTVISFYISLQNSMGIYAPYSYLCRNVDDSVKEDIWKLIKQDKSVQVDAVTDWKVQATQGALDGYKTDTNSEYGKVESAVGENFTLDVLPFSVYQKIVKDTAAKEADGNKGAIYVSELKQGECLFLDGNYSHDYSDQAAGKNIQVKTDQGEKAFRIAQVSLYKYMGAAHARTTVVLADEDYADFFRDTDRYESNQYLGIRVEKPLAAGGFYERLNQMVPADHRDRSYLEYHQLLFNMYGAYIFIGIFLRVLFLMAAGSIIFYKQLMEARDDEGRYEILRKIGMSRREVTVSVSRQIAAVFLLPFAVALLHCVILLFAYRNMVYTIAVDTPVVTYALMVVGVYFLIYAGFYLLSVRGYLKVVWKEG